MELQGKVAVVTGAATGIGQAIAKAMAAAGASVVVDHIGPQELAQQTLDEIQQAGGKAIACAADVSKQDDANRLVQQAVESFGRLDILVNNAGVEKGFNFVDYPLDEWLKILTVNLTGTFLCSQAAARQMIQQGDGGRIINISSIHEDLPLLTNSAYCASKGGIRMLMRTIAVELAPHNITVNNIGPGATLTPMDQHIKDDAKLESELMAEIPLKRWGKPSEIADLAVFLASGKASYITGSTVFIDGGMLRNAGSL